MIAEPVELTVNDPASVPLNETAVDPVRFVPRIEICFHTLPCAGSEDTNGAKPIEGLKTEPGPLGFVGPPAPPKVVP